MSSLATGPGHGAPAVHANPWLEGVHEEYDTSLARTGAGMSPLGHLGEGHGEAARALAVRYEGQRVRMRGELRRTGTDPQEITMWRWTG
ncbi:hypothetical protein AB0D35_06060 [Streptomyces sp. NPDC048301]|uniref:hypothetical protein n=1 Tax=unclassified Streptomyces TaxID=2593676 RepID=UPI00341E6E08